MLYGVGGGGDEGSGGGTQLPASGLVPQSQLQGGQVVPGAQAGQAQPQPPPPLPPPEALWHTPLMQVVPGEQTRPNSIQTQDRLGVALPLQLAGSAWTPQGSVGVPPSETPPQMQGGQLLPPSASIAQGRQLQVLTGGGAGAPPSIAVHAQGGQLLPPSESATQAGQAQLPPVPPVPGLGGGVTVPPEAQSQAEGGQL